MAESEVNLSVLKRNTQSTPAKSIRFQLSAAGASNGMDGGTSATLENGDARPLTVIEENKESMQFAPRPAVAAISTTGSTGFLTIVNLRGSEESLGITSPPKVDKDPSESDDPCSPKGPAVHDHNYSLALSVRGRPLRRSKGCGLCDGCRRPNCDKCRFCMDKPKNGGPNRLKKRCVLRVCTNMVHVQSPTRLRAQTLSASSAGLSGDDEPEQENEAYPGSYANEHAAVQQMDSDSKHTAVVMVDDPDNPADRPKRQKILPKKLTANNAMEFLDRKPRVSANTSPESHFGRRTRMMTAGGGISSLRKTRSEISLRALRRRPGPKPDVNLKRLIERLPACGKYSSLRKQLKIDMAGPGTTLSQRMKDAAVRKSIHVRRSTAYETTPTTGLLTPVPTPIPSSRVCVTPQMSAVSSGTTPLMMVADALSAAMGNGDSAGSSGLNILASGAANRPKLPSSPLVAKIDELGLDGNPIVWTVDEVQQYIASCGFLDISSQLKEEEVDGEALLDLTPVWLVQCLRIKLGPAIKLCKCIEDLRVKVETGRLGL